MKRTIIAGAIIIVVLGAVALFWHERARATRESTEVGTAVPAVRGVPVVREAITPEINTVEVPAKERITETPSVHDAAPAKPSKSEVETVLARIRDTTRPLEERKKELVELGRRKDAGALNILKAVGEARVYLNWAAVEAIGSFAKSPEKPAAAAYLQGKLSNQDSQLACAAIRGYATLMGEVCIPELADVLRNNRERPDGHQEIVCAAAVKALMETGSTAAVPALLGELARSEEKGWSLEYGSNVLAALLAIGTAGGRAGAAAYAQRLSARIPEDK
jgi:hypothetical protein